MVKKMQFLGVFFVLSFILWMKAFSIYRYLIPLELLSPIIFLALLERIVQSNRMRIAIAISIIIAIYVTFHPLDWGRGPWSDPYIKVTSAPRELPDNAVIVMLGLESTAYVIPLFPSTTRFIRPEGNLDLQNHHQFFQDIKKIIEDNKESKKLFLLFNEQDQEVNLERSSKQLGFNLRPVDCFSPHK